MGTVIDELVIALGFDAAKLDQGIGQIGRVVGEVNAQVKDFGHGLSEGLAGAETQSAQTGAAVAGVKQEAQAAGRALQEVGATGAAATAKVESGAKKAGRQVGFLGRQAQAAGKRIASVGKAALTGFAAGLAAPLLGALALNTVIKDYAEGLKRLEELNKKRNLSLKERQERQELLNKYTEKDIKLYRETSKLFGSIGDEVGKAGRELIRLLAPALLVVANALKEAIKWVKENKEHWQVLIPILAVLAGLLLKTVVPAVWAFTRALLANPATWAALALVALGVLLEDMIVWLRGGESAFGKYWDKIAKGGDIIYDFVQKAKEFFAETGEYWGELLADFTGGNETIESVLKIFSNVLSGIVALFTGDIDGALKAFESAGQAAGDLVFDAFESLKNLLQEIYEWVVNKISGALDSVKEKAKAVVETISKPGTALYEKIFGSDEEALAKNNALAQADRDAKLAARAGSGGGGGPTNVDNSSTTTVSGTTIQVDARGQTNEQVGEAVASALGQKLTSNNNRGVK